MGSRHNGKLITSLIIVFLLIVPATSYAQEHRIKVAARNASIRIQPYVDSEVALSLPIGSIFEIERKTADLYEAKFTSDIGMLISRYIQSMLVEVTEEQPEPERKVVPQQVKPRVQPKPKQALPTLTRRSRYNIALGGLFSFVNEIYSYEYSEAYLFEDLFVHETFESPNSFGFSGGIGIFLTPKIELTASATALSSTPLWIWTLDVPSPYYYKDYDSDTVDTYTIPKGPTFKKNMYSLGLNVYLSKGPSWSFYIGGGGSFIQATLDMVKEYQAIHLHDDPTETHFVIIDSITFKDTKVSAFGTHFRAGADLKVGRNISLYAEGLYVFARAEEESPFVIDDIYDLDLGGGYTVLGLKFHF